MDLHTTTFERALHFLLFVSGGLGFGIVALAALERVGGGARRTVRVWHVVAAAAAFASFFFAERAYHWFR